MYHINTDKSVVRHTSCLHRYVIASQKYRNTWGQERRKITAYMLYMEPYKMRIVRFWSYRQALSNNLYIMRKSL